MDTLTIIAAKYLIVLSPLLAAYAFLWKVPRERRLREAVFAIAALVLSYLIALVARHFWYDSRPFVVGQFTPLFPHAADNGFPSDHTLLAAAFAAVALYWDKKTAFWMWAVAIVVGAARVTAGVHHVADILGSIVIALLGTYLARAIISSLWNHKQNPTNS